MKLRRHLDLLVASAVLLASGILAAYAFAAAKSLERPVQAFMAGIREGETRHVVKAAQICPGNITTHLIVASLFGLKSSGTLRSHYREQPIDARFKTELFFNPLGQMTNGSLTMSGSDFTLEVAASSTNPVKISVNLTGPVSFSRNVEVPGPILLIKENDRYFIDYGAAPLASSPFLSSLINNFTKNHDLTLVETANAASVCPNYQTDRLDIAPLVNGLISFVGPLSSPKRLHLESTP